MRISSGMLGDRLLSDLRSAYSRMATTQEQISTGKRVNRPSDDPLAAAQARLRTGDLAGIKASQDSVDAATGWLSATENGLSSIRDVLARANELALQGANGSSDQNARNAIADEIDQLTQAAKDAMNAKFGDSYIFSGTATDTPPYATATGDAYQGDGGAVLREAGANVTLQANPPFVAVGGSTAPITAQSVLGEGTTAGDGRVLDALETLSAHLRGGTAADLAAIGTTDLQALQANATAVGSAVTAVGTMTNRADAAKSRLQSLEDLTSKSIDDLTGVDFAQAITDFTQQQSAYQAALKVGAQVIQPSLVEFLS